MMLRLWVLVLTLLVAPAAYAIDCGSCSTSTKGKMCYANDEDIFYGCNGTSWKCLMSSGCICPGPIATTSNACGYTEQGNIGTWNGLNVQTRQYRRNGSNIWALVSAVPDDAKDKHFPRGNNFLSSVTLSGSFNSSCLGAGDTAWWGLSMPDNIITPMGYEKLTEADGAVYFQRISDCVPQSLTPGPVQCWGQAANGGTTPSPTITAKSIASNGDSMCAIKSDNTVQCWGESIGGTPSPAISVKSIVMGSGVCAIKNDNTVQCWGGFTTPSPVIEAKSITTNGGAMCAIKLDNTVQCWGGGGERLWWKHP